MGVDTNHSVEPIALIADADLLPITGHAEELDVGIGRTAAPSAIRRHIDIGHCERERHEAPVIDNGLTEDRVEGEKGVREQI